MTPPTLGMEELNGFNWTFLLMMRTNPVDAAHIRSLCPSKIMFGRSFSKAAAVPVTQLSSLSHSSHAPFSYLSLWGWHWNVVKGDRDGVNMVRSYACGSLCHGERKRWEQKASMQCGLLLCWHLSQHRWVRHCLSLQIVCNWLAWDRLCCFSKVSLFPCHILFQLSQSSVTGACDAECDSDACCWCLNEREQRWVVSWQLP